MSPWGCTDSANFHCSSKYTSGYFCTTANAGLQLSVAPGLLGHSCTCPWPVLQLFPQLLLSQGPHSFFSLLQMTHCTPHSKLKAIWSSGLIPPNTSTYIFPIMTSFPLSDKRTWPFCSRTVTLPGPWACLRGQLLAHVFHFSRIASFPTAYKELLPHWSHLLHGYTPWKKNFHLFLQILISIHSELVI